MKAACMLLGACAASATATVAASSSSPALGFKPNLIFILTDDQDTRLSGSNDSYSALGSLDAMPKLKSHFLDGGARFENAFVNTPICCPSRTEFFSGRYYHNVGPPSEQGSCMHVNTTEISTENALFKFLTDHGYQTGLFGKVTNDQTKILPTLVEQKAVSYIDSPVDYNNYECDNYFHLEDGKTHKETIDKKHPVFGSIYQTSQIGNRTLKWLKTVANQRDENGDKLPFFAYLGPHAPHYPAEPAPWYQESFNELTIPLTPNYNVSSPNKASHIRQNPPLSELAKCWEDQHFRDRWRSLLSVDDLVQSVVDFLAENNILNETFIFYSSDHGYKQGQWRVGTSKQHPYETDIRVPMLASGPGIKAGSVLPQIVGNLDITATFMDLAAGAANIPDIVDGKSMVPYLLPSLYPEQTQTPRTEFIVEYKSVGTYYNDHSSCWQNGDETTKQCGGPMPAGPDPKDPKPKHCKEETNCTGCGNCYFVDSTLSNNWRLLRTIDESTGEDSSYIEFDPAFTFNATDPSGAGLQHYEFYDNKADPYQMDNLYNKMSTADKTKYHAAINKYFNCHGTTATASDCP